MKRIKLLLILFLFFVNIKSVWASNSIYLETSDTELEMQIDDTNAFSENTSRTLEYTYHDKVGNDGLWYSNSKDKDKNYINIKEYSSSKLVGDFIINSILFKDVTVNLTNSKGKINATNNENKYLKGYISFKESKYVSVAINSSDTVYGLVGDFAKNNSLKYIDCLSNDFDVFKDNNRILFESVKGINHGLIGICKFEKINKDIGYLYLNNINISNKDKTILHDNVEVKITEPKIDDIIYHKIYKYVDNSNNKFNIKMFIFILFITLIIIIMFWLFFKSRKNKKLRRRIKVMILFMLLLPINVFAIDENQFSNNDLSKVRKVILNAYKLNNDEIAKMDIDKDNKITINDLVGVKIIYNTPDIEITDGKIEKNDNYNYYSDVNKNIEISSLTRLKSLKYCFTDGDYCEPNIDYDFQSNNLVMNIRFDSSINSQRICVKVSNTLGLENLKCDTKSYLVDNIKPLLKVKSSKVYLGEDDKYDINTNVSPVYGVSGGKYKCDGKIDYGNNSIKCVITGNNGLKSEINYEIIKTITYYKKAIFFGDSITFGYANKGYGWGNYIGDNYDFSSVVNAGKSGWFISNYLNRDWIVDIVKSQKDTNYDYVILHGGCNDINKDVPIGTYSNDDFSGNYDTNTFIGGLEYYLYNVTTNWSHARIGYIINYKTPNNDGRNNEKSAPYYDKMKKVLDKWGISYLDLFDGKSSDGQYYSDILKVNTNEYLPDDLHLNSNGYKAIYPYIYDWMKDLKKYS